MPTEASGTPRKPLKKSWYHHLDPMLRGPTPPVPVQREVCPESTASIFSRLSFSWMTFIMVVGRRRPLELEDIWLINPERSIERLTDRFRQALREREQKGGKATTHRLIFTTHDVFKREFWTGGVWLLVACLCQVFIPFTLRFLLNYVSAAYDYRNEPDSEVEQKPGIGKGLALVVGMLALQLLQSVSTNQYIYYGFMIGGQTRALLISVLFNKSLDLSLEARAGSSKLPTNEEDKNSSKTKGHDRSGDGYSNSHLLTMMSSDVARIDQAAGMFHLIWTAPIQIILAFILLLVNLNYSAVAGFALLFLGVGGLTYAMKSLVGRRNAINIVTDERNARTLEVLESISVVKYAAMEGALLGRLSDARSAEVELVTGLNVIRNALNSFSIALPLFGAAITFAVYAKTGHALAAAPIFSSLALFAAIRVPFNLLPRVVGQIADAWSAFKRLEELFDADDFKDYVKLQENEKSAVEVKHATFSWGAGVPTDDESTASDHSGVMDFALEKVNLSVHHGELLAVVGAVGSGKTSLLSAIAGEMHKHRGEVNLGVPSRAFCPQQAWIRNATLRDNIVFDRPFDAERYAEVVSCCCLGPDIKSLPAGDATEIGERGATLSGGQRQRVNLARALYSDAALVLMDDPLSAVDAQVGTSIFEGAICGFLQDRTRILSTHQLHILDRCDRVLWVDGGRIKALGTCAELRTRYPEFQKLLASDYKRSSSMDDQTKNGETSAAKSEAILAPGSGILLRDEEMQQGGMSWGLLLSYLKGSGRAWYGLAPLALLVVAQGSNTLTSLWLSLWVSSRFDLGTDQYIGILISIASAQTLFFFLFGASVSILCGRASRKLVTTAIHQVVHSTMAFHDTTPLGRIVNRLSRDVEVLDNQLPESVRMFAYTLAIVVSVAVLISAYIRWFLIAVPALAAAFLYPATYYLASATQLKRFEASLRGVVYARLGESVAGTAAIRAYGVGEHATRRLHAAIDDMSAAYFLGLGNQRWVAARLDLVAITTVVVVNLMAVFLRGVLHPSVSGLLLSYSLAVTQMMQLVIRQLSEVENAMISVERLTEYATILPQEASPPPEGGVNIPPMWPDKGVSPSSGQKMAIVGRTGAGKSSIAACIFRLIELSGGRITIDGLDIARLPLNELRSRLSIIPQDPKLFRGTLRINLDPFGQSTDADLWSVVRQVGLLGDGDDSGAGGSNNIHLDMTVNEYGSNFSQGQRQLISVARALLRQSAIVFCDEATSSVDLRMDRHIQKVMMEAFATKTVITIAHRLQTIVGYDRVCVVDHGHVVELGTPRELWGNKDGVFRSLCDRDGIQEESFM
ncbi:X-Pro dipeptidyl-peptidase C-terminal non-catalytic domain-containing protein [Apiospora arundinis]